MIQETEFHFISIVMPLFNQRKFLKEAIESVLRQEYKQYELIVVDDGSTDPVVHEILQSFRSDLQIHIRRKIHEGPGSAVNYGVREAQGKYCCRLDSDDKLETNALKILNEYINRYPDVSYFYSSRYVIDESSKIVIGRWIPPDGIHRSIPFSRFKLNCENLCNHLICWRKKDFLAVNGMREDIRWAEDWDLALRMSEEYGFQNINEPLYNVRFHNGPRLTCIVDEGEKADVERQILDRSRATDILRKVKELPEKDSLQRKLDKLGKRVLLINNVVELYGGEISLWELARSLKRFTPIVVLPKNGPLQERFERDGIPVLIYDFEAERDESYRNFNAFQFLKSTIETYRIDVIHLNKVFGWLCEARILSKMFQIPLLVHVRGAVDIDEWLAESLSKIDKALFVSQQARQYLIENKHREIFEKVPAQRMEVVHDGRNLADYTFNSLKRKRVRGALNLDDRTIVAALVGYIDPRKGQDRFIDLANIVLKEKRDFKFLIIGEKVYKKWETYHQELLNKIEKYGLSDHVILTGYLDCKEVISAIDILVSLSSAEGLPGIVIEAMAAERVVIANSVGGIPEIIGTDGAGYLIVPNSIQQMKEIILDLANDADLRSSVGVNARKRVQKRFDVEQHVQKIEAIYTSLRIDQLYRAVCPDEKNI